MNPPTRSLIEHLRVLCTLDIRASELALASIESVPPDQHADARFARVRGIFGHIHQARHAWLARMGVISPRPFDPWPDVPVAALRDDAHRLDRLWTEHLARLGDADLQREFAYTSLDGSPFVSSTLEIITHVLNHATYHRGQIAMLVSQLGGTRATTDYVALTRRPG